MKAIWDQISVESLMQTIVKSISVFCIYNSNWSPLPPRPLGLAAQHTRRDLDREHSLGSYWTPLTSSSTSLSSQRLDVRDVDRTLVGEELTFLRAFDEHNLTLRERKTKS